VHVLRPGFLKNYGNNEIAYLINVVSLVNTTTLTFELTHES
jgi:hypothetical protein